VSENREAGTAAGISHEIYCCPGCECVIIFPDRRDVAFSMRPIIRRLRRAAKGAGAIVGDARMKNCPRCELAISEDPERRVRTESGQKFTATETLATIIELLK